MLSSLEMLRIQIVICRIATSTAHEERRPAQLPSSKINLTSPSTSELSGSAGTSHLLLRYMIVGSLSSFLASAQRSNLSVQRVQHFSSSGKINNFVLGVERVDDGVQARLTL